MAVVPAKPRSRAKPKRINLALQGGGAHGAFTWGVLDEILRDGRLTIDGITGASAGAVNAALLADGLAEGGPKAARERLSRFWKAASLDGRMPAVQRRALDRLFSVMPYEGSFMESWVNSVQRTFSPYDLNPFDINPLEDLIRQFVDFERLAAYEALQVFIGSRKPRPPAPARAGAQACAGPARVHAGPRGPAPLCRARTAVPGARMRVRRAGA